MQKKHDRFAQTWALDAQFDGCVWPYTHGHKSCTGRQQVAYQGGLDNSPSFGTLFGALHFRIFDLHFMLHSN